MKLRKANKYLIGLLLIFVSAGLICNYFYTQSPQKAIDTKKFSKVLASKEKQAGLYLDKMGHLLEIDSIQNLNDLHFSAKDITFYVIQDNKMVYWSDNQLNVSNVRFNDNSPVKYLLLPNAHTVCLTKESDCFLLVALIKIKNNYQYENDELVNEFAEDFATDKRVQVVQGNQHDKYAISDAKGKYLFSLNPPPAPIYSERWSMAGMTMFLLAFLVFYIIYAQLPLFLKKQFFGLKTFLTVFVMAVAALSLLLYYNIPSILFLNHLFSPVQYSSNPLLASIVHLTIVTGFLVSNIFLFRLYVKLDIKHPGFTIASSLTAYSVGVVLLFYIFTGLIHHSSLEIIIVHLNDFSLITVWLYILIFFWGISLAFLISEIAKWLIKHKFIVRGLITEAVILAIMLLAFYVWNKEDIVRVTATYLFLTATGLIFLNHPKMNKYLLSFIWSVFFTLFFFWLSFTLTQEKKMNKYKLLSQNILINGNTENDQMANILLEEVDIQLDKDKTFERLLKKNDSVAKTNDYVSKNYLRGYWNKYDMRINTVKASSTTHAEYEQLINTEGTRIAQTHFYSVPVSENKMSYLGVYPIPGVDSTIMYMEFYPRKQFKSYSFPNLLIASAPDIQSQLELSIAKYVNGNLVYSSGEVDFQTNNNWFRLPKSDFFSVHRAHRLYYIYSPGKNLQIVITEKQTYERSAYILYIIYMLLGFFVCSYTIIWALENKGKHNFYRLSLTRKFEYVFIILLIISFLGIFYVSVNYIQRKYKNEQIDNLEKKKNYIQQALQDIFYWNRDLDESNTSALKFDLQDLSYTYQTDIFVYNNQGVLIGSSQPLIFRKYLIDDRIAPQPFFSQKSGINRNEHIGKLKYLTAYADFYNGDYLQIGYIAIPQFLSQKEIKSEIEGFLSSIIHIYIIIILLAIALTLIIGQQLSAPLNMLATKLKNMHIDKRNEKIDYKLNDEIGQLVEQYNKTVDELEESVRKLAKSERESAWRTMARQVAHEINNPLTPMKLTIQQLQRTKNLNDERFDSYFDSSAKMLIEQIDNLSRIAGTFSDFARMPEAKFEPMDLAARLVSVVRLFRKNNDGIKVIYSGDMAGAYIYADPEQITQVFNNLIKNAIQSIPSGRKGIINVQLTHQTDDINVTIADNGSGIPDDIKEKLFTPNFTTKTTGNGLGLSIAKNIIEMSGGTISFESENDKGTIFKINLPKEKRK